MLQREIWFQHGGWLSKRSATLFCEQVTFSACFEQDHKDKPSRWCKITLLNLRSVIEATSMTIKWAIFPATSSLQLHLFYFNHYKEYVFSINATWQMAFTEYIMVRVLLLCLFFFIISESCLSKGFLTLSLGRWVLAFTLWFNFT